MSERLPICLGCGMRSVATFCDACMRLRGAAQDAAHEADAQLADAAARSLATNHGGAEMRALSARIRARKGKP